MIKLKSTVIDGYYQNAYIKFIFDYVTVYETVSILFIILVSFLKNSLLNDN